MIRLFTLVLSILLVGAIHLALAQNHLPQQIAEEYLHQHFGQLGLTKNDIKSYRISDNYTSQHNGVTHVYYQQQYQGIDIKDAYININIWQAQVVSINSSFVSDLDYKINSSVPVIAAKSALILALEMPSEQVTSRIIQTYSTETTHRLTRFSVADFAQEEIPVKLVYFSTSDGPVRLAWHLGVVPLEGMQHWNVFVDATDGRILEKVDGVFHCSFGDRHPTAASVFSSLTDRSNSYRLSARTMNLPAYHVYPHPVESPSHGSRAVVADPSDSLASPFGWHDDDGFPGHEHTITRGNNVWAQDNLDGDVNTMGNSPDGDSTLNFDFPADHSLAPAASLDASITNLFYWTNLMHDVFYHFGFDEVSGNFQANNYGRGGLDGDPILAFAQDAGAPSNAAFFSAPDGGTGKLRMGIWTIGGGSPRDASFDNGIIAHEIGHGISSRLTGGPATTGCLNHIKGEGWSDFFGLVMTSKQGDVGPSARGVATYLLANPPTGSGFRQYPYSTDMTINPLTYGNVEELASGFIDYHGIGAVLCAMLWDMYWAFIDQYGFDPDLYLGTGGNNMAIQLVIDGLKLQPCQPEFVDIRAAILLADQINNGGANQCLIWKVFARRGLGWSAEQRDPLSLTDNVEAFDIPLDCQKILYMEKLVDQTDVSAGDTLTYTLNVINQTDSLLTNVIIQDTLPANLSFVPGSDNCNTIDIAGALFIQLGNLPAGQGTSCTFRAAVHDSADFSHFVFRDNLESSQHTYNIGSMLGSEPWRLDTLIPRSESHAFFVPNVGSQNDQTLTLPAVTPDSNTFFYFWHSFNTESEWDGGFLEIYDSLPGVWVDLGPFMLENGYNNVVGFNSPVGARDVFGGDSEGYIQTKVDLSSFAGRNVMIRFRFVSDAAAFKDGWYVDDLAFGEEFSSLNRALVQAAEGDRYWAAQQLPSIILEPHSATSIREELRSLGLVIYPNPTKGPLTIKWEQAIKGPTTLRLFTNTGQLLQERTIPRLGLANKTQLSLAAYPAGLYLLLVHSSKGIDQYQLVKE